ncbi:MAG: energy transducer TonB [Pseudohongiella sp.]|nr:energy transducer TonB [Pseudohongiella sp.]MDO9521614.1 energy transducer TonB [Pseudohongiella sp.]MDP2127841.1 energy transducer TonB [Pseudohongiella sp.]
MTAFNGYPFSVMLAVLIHGLILGSLLIMQRADSEVLDVIRPPAVKALLVQENPQARNEQVQQQRTQQQRQEQQRQEQARQEQVRQEQARQEQARQEQARRDQAAREQAAQQAAQQETQRQAAVQQQREREQQAERERQQEAARQQEVARQQEQQRQQEAQRQEQQRQADAAAQAAADSAAREAAETESEIAMAYMGVIHDLVQRNWSRPPSARNNMTAVLRIRLVPTGDVVDVEIVRSSGDAAFDRAAENAVRAVGRFSELQGMPPRMFERNFRSLLLTFRPEDLLN